LSSLFPWLKFVDDATLTLENGGAIALVVDAEGGSMARGKAKGNTTGANLGFEAKLCNAAEITSTYTRVSHSGHCCDLDVNCLLEMGMTEDIIEP